MVKLGRVGQISRSVSDIAQAEAWYGGVLGLSHLYTFGTLAFFDLEGARLVLDAEGDAKPTESIIYFLVTDISEAYSELVERGVNFRGDPHLIHRHQDGLEEWMAFFDDPDGRPLALMAQVRPDSPPG